VPAGYSLASVLFEAMTNVVEARRGVREETRHKAGLTLQDVFYSEISRIAEVRVAHAVNPSCECCSPLCVRVPAFSGFKGHGE
jgi:hypothetical protein